MTEGIRFKQEN